MRILVVPTSPVLPPTHGGRARTYRLAVGLARAGAEVEVLAPWSPDVPLRPVVQDGVRFVHHRFAVNALPLVFRDRLVPSMISHSWQPWSLGPRQRLRRYAGWDVAQFEHVGRARWMGRVDARLTVYASHNVERDYFAHEPGLRFRDLALRQVAALERQAVRASDHVVTCTDGDAERLAELYGPLPGVTVAPNGFDESVLDVDRDALRGPARAELGVPDGAPLVLFVGSSAPHNVDAARFLAAEVLPRLDERTHLLLAGTCGPETDVPASVAARVHRPGLVDDLRPLYAAADVAVNPVKAGSGSNLKLAEYLGSGLPVVTTPVGLRGFETHRDRTFVAERAQIAEAVQEALAAGAKSGGDVRELTWDAIGARLHAAYLARLR